MKHQIIVCYSNRADRSLPLTLHLRKCIAAGGRACERSLRDQRARHG